MFKKLKKAFGLTQSSKNKFECTLVTACYHVSYLDVIGGRDYNHEFYYPTLKSLCNLGQPIIIYTQQSQLEPLHQAFSDFNFSDYKLIAHELETLWFHDFVFNIKKEWMGANGYLKNGIINNRCHHLCLNKNYWLKEAILANTFKTKLFYWIDLGLFHQGIFPNTFGGVELQERLNDSFYYPHNKNNIFNPTLIAEINKYSKKYYGISILKEYHQFTRPFIDAYLPDRTLQDKHVIAGFYGGFATHLLPWIEEYDAALKYLVTQNELVLEEIIYTMMYENGVTLGKPLFFDTWYHSVPGPENICYMEPTKENQIEFWQLFNNFEKKQWD